MPKKDDRKTYFVQTSEAWIDGDLCSPGQEVRLHEAEAKYHLSSGAIGTEKPDMRSKEAKAAVAGATPTVTGEEGEAVTDQALAAIKSEAGQPTIASPAGDVADEAKAQTRRR